jgi:hypothetical protein
MITFQTIVANNNELDNFGLKAVSVLDYTKHRTTCSAKTRLKCQV